MNDETEIQYTDAQPSDTEPSPIEDTPEETSVDAPITTEESEQVPDETELLRGEIERLQGIIEQKEAESAKTLRELEEFNRLFPDTALKAVPEKVWKSVGEGLPLSAAYALYEREQALLAQKANEINQRNASLAAGSAGKFAGKEYFSPDEVRTMSQSEVHENYQKIRNSMKHWR